MRAIGLALVDRKLVAQRGVLQEQVSAVHHRPPLCPVNIPTTEFSAPTRIEARRRAHGLDAPVIAGPLVMDAREHRPWYFAEPMQLSRAEFSILLYLAEHRNSLCPSSQTVSAVTGEELSGRRAAGVLKTQILRIRKELRRVAPGPELITNIYSIGYRLNGAGSDT